MSAIAKQFLAMFDTLPPAEQEAVFAELLTRCPVGEGGLSDVDLVNAADDVFLTYDAEEANDATASG